MMAGLYENGDRVKVDGQSATVVADHRYDFGPWQDYSEKQPIYVLLDGFDNPIPCTPGELSPL